MNERITALCDLTLKGEMLVEKRATEYDRMDIFLTEGEKDVKRLCEYIMNQEPRLTEYQTMTGFFDTDGSVVGDAFRRYGHKYTKEVMQGFYCKQVEDLFVMEWQHATADYKKVLAVGISGIIAEIDESLKLHTSPEEVEFLLGIRKVSETFIAWAEKCSRRALELSKTVENPEYRKNLEKLSRTLLEVPKNPPKTFYEACLTIYICFSADPDSLGTLDRYLSPFYFADLEAGRMTREEAGEYLQELFLMLQAATSISSKNFTRGGESHFCIGGYLPDGSDAYNDLSKLILEALTDLPTYIPQVTLRWTKTQPREVLRFAMDLERRDPHKRIAFQNDDQRIKAYTEICGFSYEDAVSYTTVGCNEPAFPGGIAGATSKLNALKSMDRIFRKNVDEIKNAASFDDFYSIYERELLIDAERHIDFDNKCNAARARDINYLSAPFFKGCIEKAKSPTRGAADVVVCAPVFFGFTNIIDSLIVVKQFVYDEKIFTMDELI